VQQTAKVIEDRALRKMEYLHQRKNSSNGGLALESQRSNAK